MQLKIVSVDLAIYLRWNLRWELMMRIYNENLLSKYMMRINYVNIWWELMMWIYDGYLQYELI